MFLIKKIIKKLFSIPFIWNTIGVMFRDQGLIVLMYHRVGNSAGSGLFHELDVNLFLNQMKWLKKNCNVIHPDSFVDGLLTNNKYKPNVLITFDDGYRCCFDYAYPILNELSLPGLVFIATEPLDNGGMIWTDYVFYLIHFTKQLDIVFPWGEKNYSLRSIDDKNIAVRDIKKYMKSISNDDRKRDIAELKARLNVMSDKLIGRQMLSWDEVQRSPDIITYGGHTHNHPIMSKISESELNCEILTCRKRILAETGKAPRYFAYPNGRYEDYNKTCKESLKKHGFELAYTTNEGVNGLNTDLLEIKRLPTNAKSIEDFVWLISSRRN